MPNPKLQTGFSLVELTVVLLLITLLASVAVRETSELGFQTRYEQTKERLEMIRQAILGNPKLIINGQQAVSGFVADMGRLPVNLRELVQRLGDCDNDLGDVSLAECNAVSGTWTASAWNSNSVAQIDTTTGSGLRYGWNGPYLNIPGNPADSDALTDGWGRLAQGYCSLVAYTNSTDCTTAFGVWTSTANDFNFGWYFDALTNPNEILLQSYGKDQVSGGVSYDKDYPESLSQPVINSLDWLIDISGGISVSFVKSRGTLPISVCSDPTKTTKAACTSPEVWYGGCSLAGYYNKTSCLSATPTAGTWDLCSDSVSATRATCEAAGKSWYGEGFGCSDQTKSNKSLCTGTLIWRSCTDNGTITTRSACSTADQIWYGDDLFKISTFPTQPTVSICLKVFYRKQDSTIGELVSDDNTGNDTATTVSYDPKTIIADGSLQTVKFKNFRDSTIPSSDYTNNFINLIPKGSQAVGIYNYNGVSCGSSNMPYLANHQNTIQVDFHVHANLPVINW